MFNSLKLWNIYYYPPGGTANSPVDILYRLQPIDQAKISHRLTTISELNKGQWPQKWVKFISSIKLYQLRADVYRIYFGIENRDIIVCHICRKTDQKAHKSDFKRAKDNFKRYLESQI